VYLRLGKAGEPDFTSKLPPWQFGKIRRVREGDDVCILSYGPIIKQAFGVAEKFAARGQSAAIYSVHTLKPLDAEGITDVLQRYRRVVVIEECAPNGSLAMNVERLAWKSRATCQLDTFTLQDKFIHCYGSHEDLLAAHGLSVPAICERLGVS
jgi:transketolase